MGGKFIYILLTLFAGVAVTVQGPINSSLGNFLKSPDLATFWSFLGGTVILATYFIFKKQALPSIEVIKSVPLWAYLGAITGLVYVSLVILVIPHLGAGTTTVLLILAQIVTALLLDKFGMFGLEVKDISVTKIIGVALMLAGVYLINK